MQLFPRLLSGQPLGQSKDLCVVTLTLLLAVAIL